MMTEKQKLLLESIAAKLDGDKDAELIAFIEEEIRIGRGHFAHKIIQEYLSGGNDAVRLKFKYWMGMQKV